MWRKSTRSGGEGNCVEVAGFGDGIGVRDSKDRQGPVLSFSPEAWQAFARAAAAGALTPPD
ncbi:DUF397 domain-containing protein [Micromonospora sagamiensis]|uniref:DUF397 domain-containing protein n=1 Tax=Micromonospora sagamiensis TaxID=47875 RepID=UPI0011A5339C|nr:DUF397 domain-containing protein [Micromonospora sagamiensis]